MATTLNYPPSSSQKNNQALDSYLLQQHPFTHNSPQGLSALLENPSHNPSTTSTPPAPQLKALKNSVLESLSKNGALSRIKAELRASVFQALQNGQEELNATKSGHLGSKSGTEKQWTLDEKLQLHLIQEGLKRLDLKYSLSVFEAESGLTDSRGLSKQPLDQDMIHAEWKRRGWSNPPTLHTVLDKACAHVLDVGINVTSNVSSASSLVPPPSPFLKAATPPSLLNGSSTTSSVTDKQPFSSFRFNDDDDEDDMYQIHKIPFPNKNPFGSDNDIASLDKGSSAGKGTTQSFSSLHTGQIIDTPVPQQLAEPVICDPMTSLYDKIELPSLLAKEEVTIPSKMTFENFLPEKADVAAIPDVFSFKSADPKVSEPQVIAPPTPPILPAPATLPVDKPATASIDDTTESEVEGSFATLDESVVAEDEDDVTEEVDYTEDVEIEY